MPIIGIWRRACRTTGKNDLLSAQDSNPSSPKQADEADEFDRDPDHGPLDEHEDAGVS